VEPKPSTASCFASGALHAAAARRPDQAVLQPAEDLLARRNLDWAVPDSDDRDIAEIRRIRDEIGLPVADLLTDLTWPPRKGTPSR
jgi:hypothetical protein